MRSSAYRRQPADRASLGLFMQCRLRMLALQCGLAGSAQSLSPASIRTYDSFLRANPKQLMPPIQAPSARIHQLVPLAVFSGSRRSLYADERLHLVGQRLNFGRWVANERPLIADVRVVQISAGQGESGHLQVIS